MLCRGLFLSSGICMDCTNIVDHGLKNQIIIEDKGSESGNLYISCFQTGFWRNWCLVAPIVWHVSAQGHYWRGTVLVSLASLSISFPVSDVHSPLEPMNGFPFMSDQVLPCLLEFILPEGFLQPIPSNVQ